ncbi:MAG: hypothetical protein QXS54_00885 [Candidatus Methanomethylicaceae archaeon]
MKVHLEPKRLNESSIDHKTWAYYKVLTSEEGVAVVVGSRDILKYDPSDDTFWRWFQLPEGQYGYGWVMGHSSLRLWCIAGRNSLASLELRSGEWVWFENNSPYEKVLYATEDEVIVRCSGIWVIDALKLHRDQLRCVKSLSVDIPYHEQSVSSSVFLPEEDRFLILSLTHSTRYNQECTLLGLSWDGKAEKLLEVKGSSAMFCFPYLVMLRRSNELVYADVRRRPIELKELSIKQLNPEWKRMEMIPNKAFVLGDDLIVTLEASTQKRRALVKLGEEQKVLYEGQGYWVELNQLGRFLISVISSSQFVYDLVDQREISSVKHSMLLKQAVQYEINHQRRGQVSIKRPLLTLVSDAESMSPGGPRVSLCKLPFLISEAPANGLQFGDSISSTRGDVVFFTETNKPRSSAFASAYIMLKESDYLQYIKPEPDYGWCAATFDDLGRVWLCDRSARYAVVIHSSNQGERCFALKPMDATLSRHIAAYANRVAIAFNDKSLAIYHYDGTSLEETSRWMIGEEINKIKPDLRDGGWWVLTWEWNKGNRLWYLGPNGPRFIATIQAPGIIDILGDWPEKTYFVYTDDKLNLHYTLDPRDGWQHIALQSILLSQSWQQDHLIKPVSLHTIDDTVFFLLERSSSGNLSSDAWFFLRANGETPQLISAFRGDATFLSKFKSSTRLECWRDWFILYSDAAFTILPEYAERSQVDELPDNGGLLFYYPSTGLFYTKPHAPYSFMSALRRMLVKKVVGDSQDRESESPSTP